ncbi:MAG: O-antigen ligase family protein, partial [Sphingomonadaceae bacterium]
MRWAIVSAQYLFALIIIPATLKSIDIMLARKAALAFVFGVAFSQLLGVIAMQFLTYDDLVPFFGRTFLLGNGRLGAMTGEANSNGAVCAFALVILFHALLQKRVSWPAGLTIGAIIIAGLLASASVTGFSASVLGVSFLLIATRFSNFARIGVPIILAIVAYIGLGGPIPQTFENRVGTALITGDPAKAGTFSGRVELISEAWDDADDTILIGLGADQYRLVSTHDAPVHNLPLLLINEGGILSLSGFIVMVGCLFLMALLVSRIHRIDGAACLAITGVFLIFAMSIPHMYARIWTAPVMLVFAMAMVRPTWFDIRHRYLSGNMIHQQIPPDRRIASLPA